MSETTPSPKIETPHNVVVRIQALLASDYCIEGIDHAGGYTTAISSIAQLIEFRKHHHGLTIKMQSSVSNHLLAVEAEAVDQVVEAEEVEAALVERPMLHQLHSSKLFLPTVLHLLMFLSMPRLLMIRMELL
jgi:hypothetical protein